ncbi:Crp/Fnr family transcriptional regulator [Sphingomonas sp. Mn802worker]|uniref:Crp/Fnr family transcriptional regulator n=1 Tax=Sphingomonas sp. Mn802worker TaxID=629773 RepID=UPI00036CA69C|nr:Crp/Fnr family transcriptional regulator [Sphingomonas sp. Mn802worker]
MTDDFLRGRGRQVLTADEWAALEQAIDRIETFPARTAITRRGDRVRESTLLIEGAMCRYLDARDGYRQLLAYHVPGDFVDMHGYTLQRLDHDVATIVESRVAMVAHGRIDQIMRDHPRLAKMLWRSTLLDAAMHREWIFRLGRLDAAGRVAHFICEVHARMEAIGRVTGDVFALPLTQQDIGEACGLTSVHVNRTLRRLREEGVADVARGEVRVGDAARLARIGEFDADYLYLDTGPWGKIDV